MKKLALGLTMALTLATAAAPSYSFGKYHKHTGFNIAHSFLPFLCDHKVKPNKPAKPDTPAQAVPEIDAAGAGLALAFVGGILAVRRERRKVQK